VGDADEKVKGDHAAVIDAVDGLLLAGERTRDI
jgi:hypothetical protein